MWLWIASKSHGSWFVNKSYGIFYQLFPCSFFSCGCGIKCNYWIPVFFLLYLLSFLKICSRWWRFSWGLVEANKDVLISYGSGNVSNCFISFELMHIKPHLKKPFLLIVYLCCRTLLLKDDQEVTPSKGCTCLYLFLLFLRLCIYFMLLIFFVWVNTYLFCPQVQHSLPL